jgi:hypothetical protein
MRISRRGVARMRESIHKSLAAGVTLLGLCACSGDDFAHPPCRTDQGSLVVLAAATGCPHLTSFDILPSDVYVGSSVALRATADGPSGATFAFAWKASNGTIADPQAADTEFQCTAPGVADLTITVTNPANTSGACEDVGHGSVTCDPAEGGPDLD